MITLEEVKEEDPVSSCGRPTSQQQPRNGEDQPYGQGMAASLLADGDGQRRTESMPGIKQRRTGSESQAQVASLEDSPPALQGDIP